MAESFVEVSAGSGVKLRSNTRTIGANTVHEESILHADPHLATYYVDSINIATATAADHILQIMAGASLNVYVRRIRVYQTAAAAAVGFHAFELFRLTTAGTGGTARTLNPLDTTDAAAGATAMSLPTTKGTEGVRLWRGYGLRISTAPTGGPASGSVMFDIDFETLRGKAIRIPAGTANGLAFKNVSTDTTMGVQLVTYLTEANF